MSDLISWNKTQAHLRLRSAGFFRHASFGLVLYADVNQRMFELQFWLIPFSQVTGRSKFTTILDDTRSQPIAEPLCPQFNQTNQHFRKLKRWRAV
jgi:hypothetical protein